MWQQWLVVLLGLWIILVPFFGIVGEAMTWTLVITGIAVAVLGLWSVQETSSERESGRTLNRTQRE